MAEPLRPGRVRRALHRSRLVAAAALALLIAGPAVFAPPALASPAESPAAPPASWQRLGYQPAGCNTSTPGTAADGTPLARCYALGLAAESGRLRQQAAAPPPTALGPADIQAAYRLPDGGEGRTVAVVVAFGYAAAEADLAVFRAHYGLPPCTSANGCFRKVDQRGGTDYPREDPGWSIEAALDLDAVSAACPKCNILLVQADDNSMANLGAAVDTAARLGATAISNSYGVAGEYRWQSRYNAHYDHPGIAVTVASGDVGYVQSYPATIPNVVAVGGTRLTRDSSARGWTETAWSEAGSGCSFFEPRPAYQAELDTGCPDTRATADISAVADPETGLAVYNTSGQDGWAQYGGTSLAAPLVAAMYALAGTPLPGSYPVTYPYRADKRGHLFDITEGSNGWCDTVLCTAGPGWDGPTGVGSPNGVAALTLGEFGQLDGTVSGTKGAGPLAGATVTATDRAGGTFQAVTDAAGRYQLALPVGDYQLTATAFGFREQTRAITVGVRDSASYAFQLPSVPSRRLTGTVRDGSGQGWPVYASILIDGYPHGPVYTDPFTGRYQVDLPTGAEYTLRVSPVDMPGYVTSTTTVAVEARKPGQPREVRHDVSLAVDAKSCTAPGYTNRYRGVSTDFTGWGDAARDGWRVTDDAGSGRTWRFDDPGAKGNLTGGSGDFAIVDGWYRPGVQDTSLISPPVDLGDEQDPVIGFDTHYSAWDEQTADVLLSLDDGDTWTSVWHASTQDVQGRIEIPIPQAAGQDGVLVRFRYQGEYDDWWQLDNVYVGNRSCVPVPGGLVAGRVRDDNTGDGLTGATVTASGSAAAATSQATPQDTRLADGFYWLFAPGTGSVELTATAPHYADSTARVRIEPGGVVRRDWRLAAGRLRVGPAELSFATRPGGTGRRTVRLRNDGDQPLRVRLVEQDRGYTSADGRPRPNGPGAPLIRVAQETSVAAGAASGGARPAPTAAPAAGAATAWTQLPEYPLIIMDNLVADQDGTVYSVAGTGIEGITAQGYAYDERTGAWRRIADLPEPRQAPIGAFVNGRLLAVGGWDDAGATTSTTYSYDPQSDRWSRRADLPAPVSAGAAASVDGRLYVVAGCTTGECAPASTATYRYDPGADTWTRLADYPQAVAFLGCAAAGDGLVCAGGVDPATGEVSSATYRYFADADTWVRMADLPFRSWGMAYADAGGKFQVIGGVVNDSVSNQAAEYDPATNVWSALPNAANALYRGGAACGLYQIGGSAYSFNATPLAQRLPGYDDCLRGSAVSWLSVSRTGELTLPPGRSITITVSVAAPAAASPGEYAARLAFVTDTPYQVEPMPVTMRVR
ncbi:carboxypeptidase regulatory-like domain-containing protein [Micromonospora sp. HM5-17]|jgi:N-acetylneuraminic acid mutarotase|uniref:carboxypeptidase regulatory-like domain-containing protein n=1 Tax=Micromonospora sp. HM5-17 TaxID=2487710 RepID=UPI000F4692A4|nr:carboxypeptidase regulatory-like domain-containing protein [Micromonospora sp. HM5-17]ROT32490.1 galactose oxidase [Micromonospora sp. HM5-17]